MGFVRVILALLVVNSHTYDQRYTALLGGGDAVTVFFAISGFYMAMILNGKYNNNLDFYVNRYLRLYPTYFIVLCASVAWFWIIAWRTHQLPPPFWIYQANAAMTLWQRGMLVFSNLTMIGLDFPSLYHWSAQKGFLFLHYVDGGTAPDGAEWCGYLPWVRQAWSIGAEIWFYLLAPFIVRRRWTTQLAIIVLSLGLKVVLESSGYSTYYIFPANLWLFVAGSLLFRLYPSIKGAVQPYGAWAAAYAAIACATGGLVQNQIAHWALLLSIIFCIPALFARFSGSKLDNAIGELSYPVYLLHLLVLSILKTGFHIIGPLAGSAVSLALALGLVRIIEEPTNRFRQRRHARFLAKASGIVA